MSERAAAGVAIGKGVDSAADESVALERQRRVEAEVIERADAVRAAAAEPTVYRVGDREVAIHPISNSLPDDVFVDTVRRHKRGPPFASNVPGNLSTYVFTSEHAYLEHYRDALYGITRKKTVPWPRHACPSLQ